MANERIIRDPNKIPVLGGVTDDANLETRSLRVDPTTNALLVELTGVASDVSMCFGDDSEFCFEHSTDDANANALYLKAPDGDATDVPVLAFGRSSVIDGVDIGQFDGITETTLAIMGGTTSQGLKITNDATNSILESLHGAIEINRAMTDIAATADSFLVDLDVTATADNAFEHYGMRSDISYGSNFNLPSGVGGLIGYSADLEFSGTEKLSVGVGNRSFMTNSGGGEWGLAVGFQILYTTIGGSVTNNFSAVLAQIIGTSPTNVYILDFTEEFMSSEETLRVLDRSDGEVLHIPVSTTSGKLIFDSVNMELGTTTSGDIVLSPVTRTRTAKRVCFGKGADIASADEITLGNDGNYFDITGTTTINHINSTDWQAGSIIMLQFDGSVTVTHSAGSPAGTEADILLAGSGNFSATSNDTLTLIYDGVTFRELARTVI